MLTRTDQIDHRLVDEDNFPLIPGTIPDAMQHIMYFLLLRLMKDKKRQDIGYLRLISRSWERFITTPREPVNLRQIPGSVIKRDALETLRQRTLLSMGLAPLPKLNRPLYGVFFTLKNYRTDQNERVSDRGLLDPKIRCFETEEKAFRYAVNNAGAMFEYTGQDLEVRPFKFRSARKLPSCGVLNDDTVRLTLFYKANIEELRSMSSSPQVDEPCLEAAEPEIKSHFRRNSQMSED